MRVKSWDRLDLDNGRATIIAASTGASVGALVFLAGSWLLGLQLSAILGIFSGAASVYIIVMVPRRILQRAAFRQALEAPSLAAAANVYLKSTRSRCKTFMMMKADEPLLRQALEGVRKRILLGYDPSVGLDEHTNVVVSDSVEAILASVARVDTARVDEGGEELNAILASSELNAETKFPIFIAVSFFMPIMLVLVASVTRNTSLSAILALLVLEIVVLDITLAVSGSVQGWGKGGGSKA